MNGMSSTGVRMLMPFMEDCEGGLTRKLKISELQAEFRKKTGSETPLLIIDGNSCINMLYGCSNSDERHLGLYASFKQHIEGFFCLLNDTNINYMVFLDGSWCKSERAWLQEQSYFRKEFQSALDLLKIRRTAVQAMLDNAEVLEFMRYILRDLNGTMVQTASDAYKEILLYIAENKQCYGILSENSNFIMAERVTFMRPDASTSTSLTVTAYDKKALASFLDIRQSNLPLLATLCGNEFLSDEELRSFHLSLLGKLAGEQERLSKRLIIRKVGEWIRKHSPFLERKGDICKIISRLIGAPELENKIFESVNSYKIPENIQTLESLYVPGKWGEILRVAEHRHRVKGAHATILSVLDNLKYYQKCCIEILNEADFPSSGTLLKALRQRFYGVLLKERPGSMGEPMVAEFIYQGEGSLDEIAQTQPIFPAEHPGLLNLWRSNVAYEEKLKLFSWAVSKKLDAMSILNIPPSFFFACLSLFYLKHEVRSGLKNWQIDAFVVHLLKPTKISLKERPFLPSLLEIHFGSLYIKTWFTILALDDACGNPLLDKEPNQAFFDGKVFNLVYHMLEDLNEVSDLLDDLKVFNNIINFLGN